jgi:ribosome biogenesis GTPase / thiamine phosphate phosphatase
VKRKGLVIKSTGSWYTVFSDEIEYLCTIKGKLRLKDVKTTNPITVGDIVEIETFEKNTGIIFKVENRKNYIIRRSTRFHKEAHLLAANIDQAILMISLFQPETPLEFIDRFLVTAEAYHIKTVLIINKIDLLSEEKYNLLEDIIYIYTKIGYKCLPISVNNRINTDLFIEMIKNKISLISGNSGVGKSSLINLIAPGLKLKTAEISDAHKSGKHTTTYSELFRLENNTYIIDSPGIKGFGLIDLSIQDVGLYFPEIFRISKNCKYANCTHTHEPNCFVIDAVKNGEISETRYRSYFNLVKEDKLKYR